jgi:ATP-dependent DNA helicase DinG
VKIFTIDDWKQFFPFKTIRKEQELAINFALNAFINEKKQFVIAELGTGTGKSATGITIARYLSENRYIESLPPEFSSSGGSYVLTTQKVLQEQYVNDFGPGKKNLLCSIKSSSNFSCLHYKDQNCGESRRILSRMAKQLAGTEFWKCCQQQCPYKLAKEAFIESPISITNFSYFLAETMYAGKLEPRDLLIVDECHNIESELGKFIEVTFSEKFAKEVLKCKIPILKGNSDTHAKQVFDWISKSYHLALSKHVKRLEKTLESRFNSGMAGFGEYSKQYEMLDKHICKVNRFISSFNNENWILNVVEQTAGKRSGRKFEFKPIDVSSYGHDMLYRFGGRTLMMSATIVDKDVFCKTIGLRPEDVAFLKVPSPFPIENRPIHVLSVGKMSIDNISTTLPKIAEIVKLLLEKHNNDKGIIHCVNFKIAQYLYEHVKSDRLMIHNSENRDQVLRDHVSSPRPTVILSPSMMEGVDLANDASRFQILCKVPFPYLGDKVVKKRKSLDPRWYPFQTVKLVIQSMGRSVRNETDFATSYILDSDWDYFYKCNRELFPIDFSKSLSKH